ncbi:hypothetical protein HYPSUDRAFT_216676 [Hypholoma sublateritium FD-334 SS-4]|uniref:Uncharacterized protein n=1 Tax=Hypholoma sublateritium (strain FD-334 SS-4) TaxID=945553 RepID=A0A0D2L2P1_HYPSF|nr:hypothetical protein HYPSUDRAFT_216676 [Hypholoma sublateritium FD-334 SS-4]
MSGDQKRPLAIISGRHMHAPNQTRSRAITPGSGLFKCRRPNKYHGFTAPCLTRWSGHGYAGWAAGPIKCNLQANATPGSGRGRGRLGTPQSRTGDRIRCLPQARPAPDTQLPRLSQLHGDVGRASFIVLPSSAIVHNLQIPCPPARTRTDLS